LNLGFLRTCIAAGALLLLAVDALSSPYAATWRRESLFGENSNEYVVLVTVMINEGSYYKSRETWSLERIDKRSGRVLETISIRTVDHESDASTYVRTSRELDSPPIDLAAFMRTHSLYAPFSEAESLHVALDATGLYVEDEAFREVVVPMDAIAARFQPSGEVAQPRLLGADFTNARPDSTLGPIQYYRVVSLPAGSDIPSSEVLIPIRDSQIREAQERVERRGSRR
jgi:hypothetical protein